MNRALIQQVLDALEKLAEQSDCDIDPFTFGRYGENLAIQALRTELEKPEPEPVAFMRNDGLHVVLAVDRHNYHEAEKRFAIPLFTKEQL